MKKAAAISKLILLSLLIMETATAQTTFYHYKLYQRIENDTLSPMYGMEREFFTKRKYYTSSIFSETRLFTGDNQKSLSYKIHNSVWYYKVNNKWKLFYDYKGKKGGFFRQYGRSYKITFKREVKIRGLVLHEISFKPIGRIELNWQKFYFSPEKGILITENSGVILLRSDFFKNELTDDELNTIFDF